MILLLILFIAPLLWYIYEREVRTQRLPAEEISSIWYVKCKCPKVLSQHTAFVIIYAVILNLPRSESYIVEDVIVFRVIPGPSGPIFRSDC